jgi:CheY-like chemotaxis protein
MTCAAIWARSKFTVRQTNSDFVGNAGLNVDNEQSVQRTRLSLFYQIVSRVLAVRTQPITSERLHPDAKISRAVTVAMPEFTRGEPMSDNVSILLVEDDQVTAEAIKRGILKAGMNNTLHIASDGVDALKLIRGEDDSAAIAQPYLIVLDLFLPRMDGIQFLEEIRRDPELRSSLVFVLTNSEDEFSLTHAYRENVAGYLLKSRAGEGYSNFIQLLKHFVEIIQFPRQPHQHCIKHRTHLHCVRQ